jgi:hypothetical protein
MKWLRMKRPRWFVWLILAGLLVALLPNADRLAAQRPDISRSWPEGFPPKGAFAAAATAPLYLHVPGLADCSTACGTYKGGGT